MDEGILLPGGRTRICDRGAARLETADFAGVHESAAVLAHRVDRGYGRNDDDAGDGLDDGGGLTVGRQWVDCYPADGAHLIGDISHHNQESPFHYLAINCTYPEASVSDTYSHRKEIFPSKGYNPESFRRIYPTARNGPHQGPAKPLEWTSICPWG